MCLRSTVPNSKQQRLRRSAHRLNRRSIALMSRSCTGFKGAARRIFQMQCYAASSRCERASLTFARRRPISISLCKLCATSRDKSKLKMATETASTFERETEIAVLLARSAGAVLLRHYHTPFLVEHKLNALQEMEEVTAADREANDLIVERLSAE